MRKHILAAAAAALTTTAASAAFADAPGRCTNADLQGSYAFHARGVSLPGAPLPAPLKGPFTSAGTATYDGRGGFTLQGSASFNGLIQNAVTRGTYTVAPDCTMTSQAENGSTFRAVLLDRGRGLFILQTNPGLAITGAALAQDDDGGDRAAAPRCDEKGIAGAYGFIAEGQAGPPTLPIPAAVPLVGVGTLRLERSGAFVLSAVRSVGGVLDPAPVPLRGRYTVAADCTLRMAFDVGFTFSGAVAGRQILFHETDPGTSLLVRAERQ